MPTRYQNFVNGGIYHIFNKSIYLDVFKDPQVSRNFLSLIKYYRSIESTISYSKLLDIETRERKEILSKIFDPKNNRVSIIAFALMPNHFHFIVEQLVDNGVVDTFRNTLNSFTRSYNLKHEKRGPIFLTQFKSVIIESEEQLYHTTRYVHLNHVTSKLISKDELIDYDFNSFHEYMKNPITRLTDESRILGESGTEDQRLDYKKFVFSRIKYQQELSLVKALD